MTALRQARDLIDLGGGCYASPEVLIEQTLGVDLSRCRVLTVHQPYADFITASPAMLRMFRLASPDLAGILRKDIENRTWDTYWRGTLLIHAGMTKNHAEMARWGLKPKQFMTGIVVGTVQLTGIETEALSPWALPGHHHWRLANPRRLARPIPYKGGQGLRTPGEDLVMQVRDQFLEQCQGGKK